MLKYIQLPQIFDSAAIHNELQQLSWIQHYNKAHYSGEWSVIALRSPGGKSDNIISVHATSAGAIQQYEDTDFLKQTKFLRDTVDYFRCEKTMVRLMKLNAGAQILTHADHEMNYESGEVRFHIPVVTNAFVDFTLDGENLHLAAGSCWYLNLQLLHSVANNGDVDRIHLVIDCIVNDWIHHQFRNATVRKEIEMEGKKKYSRDEAKLIIAHLRQMNTAVSLDLIHQMEREYEL